MLDIGTDHQIYYDPAHADFDIRETPYTVFGLVRKYEGGTMLVGEDRQHEVWKPEQKSLFIESVIIDFPLHPFYVLETLDSKYLLVDGLRRFRALYEFMTDKLVLEGMEILAYLNGKTFSNLKAISGAYRNRVEDKKLVVYVLKPSVPIEVVHKLVDRINKE